MASRNISDCVPELQKAWAYSIAQWQILYPELSKPFLTATFRDNKEQNELYASGRTKPGSIITNAKGGQSPHNVMPSKAFDICFKDAKGGLDWSHDLFKKFAEIIKTQGVEWGGDFHSIPDAPHFQVK